jgi:hypothetical protein
MGGKVTIIPAANKTVPRAKQHLSKFKDIIFIPYSLSK